MKNNIYISLIGFFFILGITKSHSQLNANTIGDADSLGGNCYRITEDILWQAGGVWYDNPIDFANDFTIYYKNNFGTKDTDGADGMALVFKMTSSAVIGASGAGIGYEGIANSLVVEFDTYQNTGVYSDPWHDHIAILENGIAHHSSGSNLAGPVQPTSTLTDMEDGVDHNVKIVWTAATQTFEVFFDCELRLTLTQDIKNTIFGGDSSVFFGFVGSTGGLSNLHQVCFNRISFIDNLVLQDQTICEGESLQVDAEIPSGDTYTWSPSAGVSDINIANPILSPSTTTTYTVTIEDECGDATTESVEITVTPKDPSVFNPISPICIGDPNPLPTSDTNGVTGTWSPAFDPNTTTTYTFTPDAGQCADNVDMTIGITPLTIPTFTAIDPICIGDTIGPLPTTSNNGIAGTWSPLTIDNTTTTEYTFTPNGSGCFDETTLEIVVLQQVTPTFQIDDICIGETIPLLPNFSQEGIVGTWSPAINNLVTTTYTFTPDSGQCANSTTETIQVNPINTLAIITENTSAPFESNQIIEVTVTGGSGNYEYQLDGGNWQTSSIFQNVVGCQDHIVKVRDAEGCSNEPESTVTILSYPKFFTPNGDGFNDFWNIKCLRNSAGLVSIFDRFGKLLKQFKTTSAGWNGTYNNNLMPTNDYWFLVTYYDENGIEKEFRSHFTLRR